MLQKDNLSHIILALLIYLPTCAYMPLALYLVLIACAIYLNFEYLITYTRQLFKGKVIDRPLTFFLGLALAALILRLCDYSQWESIRDHYSYAYLFPLTYLVAKTVSTRPAIFKYILYFIIIEAVFAFLEYLGGFTTFFTGLKNYREFESYELLYFTRVFGLSENSSGLSLKYIVGLMILAFETVKLKPKMKLIFEFVLLGSSLLTFGRIALVAIGFYYGVKGFDSLFIRKNFRFKTFLPFGALLLVFAINPIWTKNQFTRNNIKVSESRLIISADGSGTTGGAVTSDLDFTEELGIDKIDMSGRNEIWNAFLNFTADHLWWGNMGKKYMIQNFHAHNAYIEFLSSFGIILTTLLLVFVGSYINLNNYVFIVSLMFLAIGQYLIFWGISFFDIIFYYLLFFYKPINEQGETG